MIAKFRLLGFGILWGGLLINWFAIPDASTDIRGGVAIVTLAIALYCDLKYRSVQRERAGHSVGDSR